MAGEVFEDPRFPYYAQFWSMNTRTISAHSLFGTQSYRVMDVCYCCFCYTNNVLCYLETWNNTKASYSEIIHIDHFWPYYTLHVIDRIIAVIWREGKNNLFDVSHQLLLSGDLIKSILNFAFPVCIELIDWIALRRIRGVKDDCFPLCLCCKHSTIMLCPEYLVRAGGVWLFALRVESPKLPALVIHEALSSIYGISII